jgi:hypothetical protein
VHDTSDGLRPLVGSRSQRGEHVREVCEWTRGGMGDLVSSRCAGSDTFGLVRRPVALSGLLLLWPSDFVTL